MRRCRHERSPRGSESRRSGRPSSPESGKGPAVGALPDVPSSARRPDSESRPEPTDGESAQPRFAVSAALPMRRASRSGAVAPAGLAGRALRCGCRSRFACSACRSASPCARLRVERRATVLLASRSSAWRCSGRGRSRLLRRCCACAVRAGLRCRAWRAASCGAALRRAARLACAACVRAASPCCGLRAAACAVLRACVQRLRACSACAVPACVGGLSAAAACVQRAWRSRGLRCCGLGGAALGGRAGFAGLRFGRRACGGTARAVGVRTHRLPLVLLRAVAMCLLLGELNSVATDIRSMSVASAVIPRNGRSPFTLKCVDEFVIVIFVKSQHGTVPPFEHETNDIVQRNDAYADRVRALALSFPKTYEDAPWGFPVFKVGANQFVRIGMNEHDDRVDVTVKLSAEEREIVDCFRGCAAQVMSAATGG